MIFWKLVRVQGDAWEGSTETPSGREIPIEERSPEEVTHIQGVRIAPEGVGVANPAFDVTPHYYVTSIITEKGVVVEPYEISLKKVAG